MSAVIGMYDCVRVGEGVLGFVVEKHPVAQQVRLVLLMGRDDYGTTAWFDSALCEEASWLGDTFAAEVAACSDAVVAQLTVVRWARAHIEKETAILQTPEDELSHGDKCGLGLLRIVESSYGMEEKAKGGAS